MAVVTALAILAGYGRATRAQAPVIEQSGLLPTGTIAQPGGAASTLGPMPGGGANLGIQPGRDEMLFGGRAGPATPRVPTAITMPGGTYQGPQRVIGVAAPQPVPVPQPPFYGTLEVDERPDDLGPANGLTLDQAIEIYVNQNLGIRALALELPQARADVVTAGLRANPILYADSQLVPYGSYNRQRPGGPTQYDLNISHPIDYSHKRLARMTYAERALMVMERQYQDAVRRGLGDLYTAYVDVLAARRTVQYARNFARGADAYLRVTEELKVRNTQSAADVEQARADSGIAAVSLLDAEESLRKAKRTLAVLLNMPPSAADRLDLRGSLEDLAPPPPTEEELVRFALQVRPDVVSYRLGVSAAQAAYELARANRFADAYLLYQPFTFQNDAPYGTKSATSWALGITVPLPVYNRNQGNIERARINITQSHVQLTDRERIAENEVHQALAEYLISRRIASDIRNRILPPLKRAIDQRRRLHREGETDVYGYYNQMRNYNEKAKAYLDSTVRHRKAMLMLNTAVGQRILP